MSAPLIEDDLRVFTKQEVAERLKMSTRNIERLVADGSLRPVRTRVGKRVTFSARELREYIYGGDGR